MPRFIAFDVETPNHRNHRMSAIGAAVVEDGAVIGEFYSLVDPETEFDAFNIRLTGICEETVRGAPNFPRLWERLGPLMESGLLVAHNAPFDLSVLRSCLRDYDIEWRRTVPYLCTVQMGRRLCPGVSHRLDEDCRRRGIPLDHHHAGSDSRACAELLLRYLADGARVDEHIRTYALR